MASIIIVGASGNIGSCILREAIARGHAVTAASRDPGKFPEATDFKIVRADTHEVEHLAELLRENEVAIFAVKWNENDIDSVIEAIRLSGVARAIVVVGAGSLEREDGRLHFDHMKDKGIEPPTSRPAMLALDALRVQADIVWTAISPPVEIYPGERTGVYRLEGDIMPEPSVGFPHARISREDFAVAILDEVQGSQHLRRRFTAAN
ncbi:NAD(P)-dependent oxidoreductase [Novosphingobium sp.]|uniref:NAD(P)-dependent oxidoreductase n=1 Tax=Novosphingobium sp. TaxID=1874826 RepID=UPI002FE3B66F